MPRHESEALQGAFPDRPGKQRPKARFPESCADRIAQSPILERYDELEMLEKQPKLASSTFDRGTQTQLVVKAAATRSCSVRFSKART